MSLVKKAAGHLKALREHNGLSKEQFATLIGKHRPAVSRWEAGTDLLTMKTFDEICASLQLDPTGFLCADPKRSLSAEVIARASKA